MLWLIMPEESSEIEEKADESCSSMDVVNVSMQELNIGCFIKVKQSIDECFAKSKLLVAAWPIYPRPDRVYDV